MNLTPDIQSAVRALKAESKFHEVAYYPGAPNEEIRQRCEGWVNAFLDRCQDLLREGATAEILYQAAEDLQGEFSDEDTEEAERVGDYIGEFMRAVGLHNWPAPA